MHQIMLDHADEMQEKQNEIERQRGEMESKRHAEDDLQSPAKRQRVGDASKESSQDSEDSSDEEAEAAKQHREDDAAEEDDEQEEGAFVGFDNEADQQGSQELDEAQAAALEGSTQVPQTTGDDEDDEESSDDSSEDDEDGASATTQQVVQPFWQGSAVANVFTRTQWPTGIDLNGVAHELVGEKPNYVAQDWENEFARLSRLFRGNEYCMTAKLGKSNSGYGYRGYIYQRSGCAYHGKFGVGGVCGRLRVLENVPGKTWEFREST